MLRHTLGFSHLQHLVRACHTPFHHALACIQCLHGLCGHSNHMGSEILMLESWQLIKEQVLNLITDHSMGHTTDRKVYIHV